MEPKRNINPSKDTTRETDPSRGRQEPGRRGDEEKDKQNPQNPNPFRK